MSSERSSNLRSRMADAVAEATARTLETSRMWQERGAVWIAFAHEPSLVLEVRPASGRGRCYREVRSLAFSYRYDGELSPPRRRALDAAIDALAALLSAERFDPSASTLAPPPRDAGFPTPYQRAHLASEVDLDPAIIDAYRRDGHVLVRRALGRDVVLAAAPHLWFALERAWPRDLPPPNARPDAYARSFTQIVDLGLSDPELRTFAWSRRVLGMAAQLMGVSSLRLFCEDWLIKEAGAGITPWHQDEAVFPFDAEATITCWIPLGDVGPRDGLLRFARGAQRLGIAHVEDINDVSEAEFATIIAEAGLVVDTLPPVFAGDVSFHDGKMIHGAFPNEGDSPRAALALHCFADGARIKAPTTPKMRMLLENSAPDAHPGDPAASTRWPLVYPADAPRIAPSSDERGARVHGTTLPDGRTRDLFVVDGCIHSAGPADAELLTRGSAFVTSGLFECHGHISYPHDRDAPVSTEAWLDERRTDYAVTGVTAIRDMGSIDDAPSQLLDVPGLPRVHACGTMILRNDEWPFTATEPEDLVRAAAERIERGGRWVKVFADFTSDYRGRINSGFTRDDAVSYPLPLLSEAVRVVHSLGGRVAAHCFTHAGAEVAVRAGVDSLEHGWGLDEALLAEMAQRGTAWAPLTAIAHPMWRIARRDRQPERATWIEQTMVRLAELLPHAESRGVLILAGTDLFPEVTVADEIRQLHELGLSRMAALAAGSFGARAYFREPAITEGAPADLVVYPRDPREDLSVLDEPTLIVIGGVRVEPSHARVRDRYASWAQRLADDAPAS